MYFGFNRIRTALSLTEFEDDGADVNLDWAAFHIHVHGLPLTKMSKEMAQFIGDHLGRFIDVDVDSAGHIWGSSMRLRVSLEVTKPLKRVLKIRTTIGDEQLISFTYEKLPNFCYLCGCPGNLSKFCALRFPEDFTDLGNPFTWCNQHPEPDIIYERLDKACADPAQRRHFSYSVVRHILVTSSDHLAILIDTENVGRPLRLNGHRPMTVNRCLCNVAYKIASKAITNRLKLILDTIISPSQAAFVPGRLITENVLLAFEVNHYLRTKRWGKKWHMALKLDISKANDKVEWKLLQKVLARLGRLLVLYCRRRNRVLSCKEWQCVVRHPGNPSFTWRSIFGGPTGCAKGSSLAGRLSAYHVAVSLAYQPHPCSSLPYSPLWKIIWKTNVPAKFESLHGKHVFLQCPFARQVWCLSHLRWALVLNYCSGTAPLWNEPPFPPSELLLFALNYLLTYHQVCTIPAPLAPKLSPDSWFLPGNDEVKINFDDAMFEASLEIGIGLVTRDAVGACVWWKSVHQRWVPEPELVEAIVAREAVFLARRFGWRRIVLEGNCANLHLKLSLAQADYATTRVVTWDITRLISEFENCVFWLVCRTTNKVAHCLAKKASSGVLEGSCFPPLLAEQLFSDFI
ncbi:hypothetical protein Sango_0613800 [Sesamum angolense]|uniref:Reverse transcriptase domain-containing protein n=1 Tax=Sesamum angolense TaxID=2727404 RepID=A0AAE1X6A8_9LAMI|nr:hypothetical protein Sango_0613800 [Sesamum angolense]